MSAGRLAHLEAENARLRSALAIEQAKNAGLLAMLKQALTEVASLRRLVGRLSDEMEARTGMKVATMTMCVPGRK